MSTSNQMTGKSNQNYGWVLLFIVALLQALSALFLLISIGPELFKGDTGVAWAELSSVFPTVATQFTMAQQSSLVSTLAVVLFSLAVTYFAFRTGLGMVDPAGQHGSGDCFLSSN